LRDRLPLADRMVEPREMREESTYPQGTDFLGLRALCLDRLRRGMNTPDEVCGAASAWIANGTSDSVRHGKEVLELLITAGVRLAMFNLAAHLLARPASDADVARAHELFRRVADSEAVDLCLKREACGHVADGLVQGRGVPSNVDEAFGYYVRAADLGSAIAASNVGAFLDGRVPGWEGRPDHDRALSYYEMAVQGGDDMARTLLGVLHLRGVLSTPDPAFGKKLLRESMAAGDPIARAALLALEVTEANGDTLPPPHGPRA